MLGLIEPVDTHMYITQASGSSPIVNAYQAGSVHIHPVIPNTIARSIAVGNPADGYYALMVARQSGGGACAVTDQEAIDGVKLLAETEGIFAEPVGGVVIGSLAKLASQGVIKKDELVVAFITGAGPRTQEILSDIVQAYRVKPTLQSVEEVLGTRV